ncbi:hypothetical protein BC834DRAFT_251626 [Gloeopeniophorella convolvens]|nr:hypothetical protein BC834DRAFT_251626 [Gloeopeniophorella convolvens]
MARFAFTLLTLLAARLAATGPVALDNSTLLANGQQAQVLNAEFQTLNKTDSCEDGQIACIKGDIANCAEGTWQTQACSSGKSCFALPQVRSEGIFVACTSENNAASIIGSTGAQGGIASNSTFGKEVPFPTANSTNTSDDSNDNHNDGDCIDGDDDNGKEGKDDNGKDQGDDNGDDDSSDEQTVTVTVTLPASGSTTLPPTTTTLSPSQASIVISAISAAAPSASPAAAGDNNNQQSNAGAAPPVIHLTPAPPSSPAAATATSAPSSSAIVAAAAAAAPADAGYSY